MIAVCLLTCGRSKLTAKTIRTFAEHNAGRRDLILVHADGGGDEQKVGCQLAADAGFKTVHRPKERVPQMVSFRTLVEESAVRGAEFLLWLENDFESVGPIPPLKFLQATAKEGIVSWRMYGARKMRGEKTRGASRETRIGTHDPINWERSGHDGWEIGLAHWPAGGAIATLTHLESQYHQPRFKDVITAKPQLPSLRPVENAMYHIGKFRTEGFMT